ncbi:MAG: helix-turn-helix transcriptional regulator [Gemmatimonadales bacterium]
MPARRVHRGKSGWKDDPYVVVNPRCLAAAIEARGWTVQKTAKAIGNASQTLDHLVKGERDKRCRQSRREALAKVLGVSQEWLAGTGIAVPELSQLPRHLAHRLSPRAQFAVGELFRKAKAALARDIREPGVLAEMQNHGCSKEILQMHLFTWLFHLVRPNLWKSQLTTFRGDADLEGPSLTEVPGLLKDMAPDRSHREESAEVGLIQALEIALEPWFSGEAKLDYDRLRVLVGYDRASPPPGPPHPRYQGVESSPVRMIPQIALGLKT